MYRTEKKEHPIYKILKGIVIYVVCPAIVGIISFHFEDSGKQNYEAKLMGQPLPKSVTDIRVKNKGNMYSTNEIDLGLTKRAEEEISAMSGHSDIGLHQTPKVMTHDWYSESRTQGIEAPTARKTDSVLTGSRMVGVDINPTFYIEQVALETQKAITFMSQTNGLTPIEQAADAIDARGEGATAMQWLTKNEPRIRSLKNSMVSSGVLDEALKVINECKNSCY